MLTPFIHFWATWSLKIIEIIDKESFKIMKPNHKKTSQRGRQQDKIPTALLVPVNTSPTTALFKKEKYSIVQEDLQNDDNAYSF